MPIHNWSKVEANLFHDFHQTWTVAIRNALNGGLLPKDFSALVEQRTGAVVPDVITVEHEDNGKNPDPIQGGAVVIAERPKTRHFFQATKALLADKANRVAIRHELGDLVCVIEILSPGNKSSRAALGKFVEKSVQLLQHGVHLLMVDLFPPTSRDPQGIHKAIWDEIDENAFTLPSDQPLTLAAYLAGDPFAGILTTAYIEPTRVGEKLVDMPAWLNHDGYVNVPLEATYEETWRSCPAKMRAIVEQKGP